MKGRDKKKRKEKSYHFKTKHKTSPIPIPFYPRERMGIWEKKESHIGSKKNKRGKTNKKKESQFIKLN